MEMMMIGEMQEGGVVEGTMVGVAGAAAAVAAEVAMEEPTAAAAAEEEMAGAEVGEEAAGEHRSPCNRRSRRRARDLQTGRWLIHGARSTR